MAHLPTVFCDSNAVFIQIRRLSNPIFALLIPFQAAEILFSAHQFDRIKGASPLALVKQTVCSSFYGTENFRVRPVGSYFRSL